MLREPIQQLVDTPSAGFALVASAVVALWSASGYIGAFGRAMNRIYEIDEGRPIWKLRPLQLLLTLSGLVMAAAVAFMLAVSGPVATAAGDAIGAGEVALTVWNVVRWPLILLFVILVVAILYYATPNVQQPRFRWISVGAAVAILVWIVASVLFGVYVANFGSYNKTYGALAGQLQAGMPAERDLQLPPKDTRVLEKNAAAEEEDIKRGRWLRRTLGRGE